MKNQKMPNEGGSFNEGSSFKEVLEGYRGEALPTLINSRGDNLIKPTYRRVMKQKAEEALRSDLIKLLYDGEGRELVAEVMRTYDGLMVVASNDYEGCYTIEIQVKIKNLDYDAYELDEVGESDEGKGG